MTPSVGQVYKMGISFGNQVRVKCPLCKVFIPVALETTCNRCGTQYVAQGFGKFEVVAVRG